MYLHNKLSKNKELFCGLLRSINRPNTEKLLLELERLGFFMAPASCHEHLPFEGGLLIHSLNTYCVMRYLSRIMKEYADIPHDSIVVCSLLHDVCKADRYSLLCDGTYQRDFDSSLPIGHSEKSLAIIMGAGFPLSESEIAAIRWHMAPYRLNKQNEDEMYSYECAIWKYPLVTLISCSDTLCAKVIEVAAQWLDV